GLSAARNERSGDHRFGRVLWLLPVGQSGHHRSLRARAGRDTRGGQTDTGSVIWHRWRRASRRRGFCFIAVAEWGPGMGALKKIALLISLTLATMPIAAGVHAQTLKAV